MAARAPVGHAHPVEDVPHEVRVRGTVDVRVVEVASRVAHETDPLHDPNGADVLGHRERDDLLEAEVLEAEAQRLPGGLGRVAAPQCSRASRHPTSTIGSPVT
jgi:hypothetical protein